MTNMLTLTLTDNAPITLNKELKQRIINAVDTYIEENWNTVISFSENVTDDAVPQHLLEVNIEL